MEERLAESEKRVATEAQKQFDLELAELRERIEAVQKVNTHTNPCFAKRRRRPAYARSNLAELT